MTLLELCEPLFLYVCRLNRTARAAGELDYGQVRFEVQKVLEEMQERCGHAANLQAQVQTMKNPLIFFIDGVISTSRLVFADQWNENRLAYAQNEKSGDEKFFDLLDAELQGFSGRDEQIDRLSVYFICLGLGFEGMYCEQPEMIRKYLNEITQRIPRVLGTNMKSLICQEAYDHVNTTNLIPPPSNNWKLVVAMFVVCCVGALIAYSIIHGNATHDLRQYLAEILVKSGEVQP